MQSGFDLYRILLLSLSIHQRPIIPSGLWGADACGGGGKAGLT